MNTLRNIILIAMASLLVVACSVKRSIVGKWHVSGDPSTVEFADGGILRLVGPGSNLQGSYAFDENGDLQLRTNPIVSFGYKLLKVKISGDEMTLTDETGGVLKYQRVKG
jgi:hypothetical protein